MERTWVWTTSAVVGAAAVGLAATGRFGRRAALRGGSTAAATLATGALLRRTRSRPAQELSPVAATAAFATGAALELPSAAAPLAALVAIPSAQLVRRGAAPARVGAAIVAGAGVAWLSRRSWPVAPHEPARARPHLRRAQVEPLADGTGLTFVVNSAAGSLLSGDGVSLVEKAFPAASVEAVEEGDDLGAVLSDLQETDGMRALGIAGGDGSVRAAAEAALRLDVPLVVIPAGTLNHFARDLGLATVADAVDAVASGQIVEVDVGQIDGRLFLNAAALGAYPDLIDAREQLESRIGKWPAVAVALVRVLRREAPADLELDGQPRRVWMVFVGNCRYHPSGFAPGWRERLDDGQLDIRVVDATRPWARTRLLLAVLSGRLGRSQVYDQFRAVELSIRCLEGPMRLAIDGESVSGEAELVVRKHPRSLRVYVPSG